MKTINVAMGNEVVKSRKNKATAEEAIHTGGVVRKDVNVVGDKVRDERSGGGERSQRKRSRKRGA